MTQHEEAIAVHHEDVLVDAIFDALADGRPRDERQIQRMVGAPDIHRLRAVLADCVNEELLRYHVTPHTADTFGVLCYELQN